MRFREFLREYSREITAKNLGPKLLQAATLDRNLENGRHPQNWTEADIPMILQFIEVKDSTPSKRYTQWLARMYAKGGVKLEDLNRHNLLGLYDLGKRRRMINPEHADINKFPTYKDFDRVMNTQYDLDAIQAPVEDELQKGNSETVLDTAEVRVIIPKDKTAACYYGQGTQWCTAATKGANYFDNYNRQGPMFILLPKKPAWAGEKYQFHFASDQFMNEQDEQQPLDQLLKERFPSAAPYFLEKYPEIYTYISFAPDEVLIPLIQQIKELVDEHVWDEINEWQSDDDYFSQWQMEQAQERGYIDADGEIDWDKVSNDDELNDYLEYNDEARRYYKNVENALDLTPVDIREYQGENTDDVHYIWNIDDVVGDIVGERSRERDWTLGKWIKGSITIRKTHSDSGGVLYTATLIGRK